MLLTITTVNSSTDHLHTAITHRYFKKSVWKAITTHAALTHGESRSPTRLAFQQIESNPVCVLGLAGSW